MAKAPYRFIPIEPGYVQAPPVKRKDIRFDAPLSEGSVSATLSVTWTAKTPVCIGTDNEEESLVEPLRLGGRYCLPGTSLRGMLRSVLEIATFSHLGRINAHHHHGVRDFRKDQLPFMQAENTQPSKFKGGWLRWSAEDKLWRLFPCSDKTHRFVLLPISQMLEHQLQKDQPAPLGHLTEDHWRERTVAQKYAAFGHAGLPNPVDSVYPLEGAEKPKNFEIPRVALKPYSPQAVTVPRGYPNRSLYYVFSDAFNQEGDEDMGNVKKNEALFPAPATEGVVIPESWMRVFHFMHSDPSREGGNPRGAWRAWLRAMAWTDVFPGFRESDRDEEIPDGMKQLELGIPVFWKGALDKIKQDDAPPPGQQDFWFSLSRVMRVPHGYSVGDVAKRLYSVAESSDPYRPPRLEEPYGWDFARALFGEVDGANVTPDAHASRERADLTRREDAQRGRVSVGFAYAPEGTRPESATKEGVFARPRESFWPFYLRHKDDPSKTVSYSSEHAAPAGRKRTVVRSAANPNFPRGNENERTLTRIRFLPSGTTFTGDIRVHNLHPVEFGALLYAVTFGRTDGPLWHQIGRAKGMGHGVIAPTIEIAKGARFCGESDASPSDRTDIGGWITLFRRWMTERMTERHLGSHEDHPAIRMLEAMADPRTGDRMGGQLETGELKDFGKWRDQAGCQTGEGDDRYPLSSPLD